jgi:hypothetical protein
MAEVVRLKHTLRQNDWKFYHYKGSVDVHNGVIELPADNPTLIRRAWIMGFRLTEDGQPIKTNKFEDIVAQATVDSQEEPKSEQKSSSGGRQSRNNNGVRSRKQNRSRNVTRRRAPRSVPSGSGNE